MQKVETAVGQGANVDAKHAEENDTASGLLVEVAEVQVALGGADKRVKNVGGDTQVHRTAGSRRWRGRR